MIYLLRSISGAWISFAVLPTIDIDSRACLILNLGQNGDENKINHAQVYCDLNGCLQSTPAWTIFKNLTSIQIGDRRGLLCAHITRDLLARGTYNNLSRIICRL